jgi:hypothetical protein
MQRVFRGIAKNAGGGSRWEGAPWELITHQVWCRARSEEVEELRANADQAEEEVGHSSFEEVEQWINGSTPR